MKVRHSIRLQLMMSKRKQFWELSTRQKRRRRKEQLQADLGEEPVTGRPMQGTSQACCEIPEHFPVSNEDDGHPTALIENPASHLSDMIPVNNDNGNDNQDILANSADVHKDIDVPTSIFKNPTLWPGGIAVENNNDGMIEHDSLSDHLLTRHPSEPDRLTDDNPTTCHITAKSSTNEEFSLSRELNLWALLCYVPHVTLNLLLSLLRKAGHDDLPRDARTLLQTPRRSAIRQFSKGSYIHYGLESALLYQLANSEVTDLQSEIQIDINVDGLPLAKSSQSSLWPILGRIVHPRFRTPFVIGAYHYYSKPDSAEEFLTPFIEEYMRLHNEGFYHEGRKYIPSIRAVICDSPARCFVTCTKQFNGYYGCPKCTTEGTYLRFVTFLELDAPLRTDEAFKNRYQEEHHTGTSPFERASLNMVSQFPLDYMHVVLLGVMKKLLLVWLTVRGIFSPFARTELSKRLIRLRKWMPREFSRKPRGVDEVKMWKATEFRLFLLYIGPSILRDLLPENHLRHFNALHCACRILCNPVDCIRNNSTAKDFLVWFVRRYVGLYGAEAMVSNVHNLIHISDDVKLFGPLDSYCAFPFENFMQTLKKLLRSSANPLQQLHRGLTELLAAVKPDDDCQAPILLKSITENLPLGCSHSHTAVKFPQFYLSIKRPDNCCYMKDGSIVVIEHIGYRNEKPVILGRRFKQLLGMLLFPFNSKLIDMYLASKLSHLSVWQISEVDRKAVTFPINKTQYSVMPLLHSLRQ